MKAKGNPFQPWPHGLWWKGAKLYMIHQTPFGRTESLRQRSRLHISFLPKLQRAVEDTQELPGGISAPARNYPLAARARRSYARLGPGVGRGRCASTARSWAPAASPEGRGRRATLPSPAWPCPRGRGAPEPGSRSLRVLRQSSGGFLASRSEFLRYFPYFHAHLRP